MLWHNKLLYVMSWTFFQEVRIAKVQSYRLKAVLSNALAEFQVYCFSAAENESINELANFYRFHGLDVYRYFDKLNRTSKRLRFWPISNERKFLRCSFTLVNSAARNFRSVDLNSKLRRIEGRKCLWRNSWRLYESSVVVIMSYLS